MNLPVDPAGRGASIFDCGGGRRGGVCQQHESEAFMEACVPLGQGSASTTGRVGLIYSLKMP